MADGTQEIDWNDLRPGDIQVRPKGNPRTVIAVTEVPGINWVTFEGGPVNAGDGGRVTIRARDQM